MRPLACRGHASHDRRACGEAAAGRREEVPFSGPHRLVRSIVQSALQAMLRERGLAHGAYELNQALVIALQARAGLLAWLAGGDPLADAAIDSASDLAAMGQVFDQPWRRCSTLHRERIVHVVATTAMPLWHLRLLRHSAVTPDTLTDPSPDEASLLWLHHERLALDRHFKAGRALIERVGPQPGERVLELACGTGQLTEVLAQRVGPRGDVLGLDPMPLRVHLAHQQYTLRQLRFQIGDVGQLERFPNGVFDVVISNGALRPGPQGLRDLASLRRLVAPGGRLGVSIQAAEPVHPAALVLAEVLRRPAFAAYRGAAGAGEDVLTAPGLATALQEAGFDAVAVDTTSEESVFVHPEAALAHMQAQASEPFLGCLPVYLRAPARADVMQRLAALPRLEHKAVRMFGVACVAGARP